MAAWYTAQGRHHLPWRQTDDPYRIWLSEVMLQQTQVATVLARFYPPFLEKFPTVQALAEAPREQVMKAWEGLGYYRRAGFLHEGAKKAVALGLMQPVRSAEVARAAKRQGSARETREGGASPPSLEQLQSLPGIGKNTAHAIAAFAYRQPVAILEANVKRIVARVFAWEKPSDTELWDGAQALLNTAEPFDHNQAMMDLGSMVCTPKKPDCPSCPANSICKGKKSPERYPAPKPKKATPTRAMYLLVLEDAAGHLHLEAREAALLGGLYGFPQVPVTTDLRYPMREMHAEHWEEIGHVTHIYSHFRLEGRVVHARLHKRMNSPGWFSREEISALPLSGVDHKVLALLQGLVMQRNSAAKPATKAPRKPRAD
ncbi:MAG: A/G-specific adenine glycosylase [Azospirillum brasilense]|nr:MAG: A/G-specific adenine glycosylase [Azospirillum brasilense]